MTPFRACMSGTSILRRCYLVQVSEDPMDERNRQICARLSGSTRALRFVGYRSRIALGAGRLALSARGLPASLPVLAELRRQRQGIGEIPRPQAGAQMRGNIQG